MSEEDLMQQIQGSEKTKDFEEANGPEESEQSEETEPEPVSQVTEEEVYPDVSQEDHSLVIKENLKVNNLYDLIGFIQSIPEEDFSKFAREKKRVVQNWLKQIHGDEAYITELFDTESKKDVERKLKKKLKELEELEKEAKEFTEQIKKGKN